MIKINGFNNKNVDLQQVIVSNFGTSIAVPPIEATNAYLYVDVNQDGFLDGGDTPLKTDVKFSGNSVVFSNFSTTINAGVDKYLIVVFDFGGAFAGETYVASALGSDMIAYTNGVQTLVLKASTGYTQTVSGGFDHFVIQHNTNAYVYIPEPITISAVDINGVTINGYTGTITISASGALGEFFQI